MIKEDPQGELMVRVMAMPKDTNAEGDIFGGWILSQMDIAGGIFCQKIAKGRVVTVAIESINFKLPVYIGDTLCCYVSMVKLGNSSMTVKVDVYVNRQFESENRIKVTEGIFKYVKIGKDGKSKELPKK